MSKNILYTIIVIIIIAAVIWFWRSRTVTNAPTSDNNSSIETAAALNSDLNGINVEDPDFGSIDNDTNSL